MIQKMFIVGMLFLAPHESAILRPFVLPSKTPKERVGILRKAFMDTLNDSEFLDEAKKARIDITPITGQEVERIVAGLFKLAPDLVSNLTEILYK